MLTPEQIEQRRTMVTASDAGAILGIDPWRTAHDVWAEKVLGEREPDKWRFARGHALEEPLVGYLDRKIDGDGLRAIHNRDTKAHAILTWLGATVDLEVYEAPTGPLGGAAGVVAVGDAKVTSGYGWGERGARAIPDHYLVQFQIQMTVRKVQRHYCVVDVLEDEEPTILITDHDPDLEAAVLEELDAFRRVHLEAKVPPPNDGSPGAQRLVKKMWGQRAPTGPRLAATPEAEELARQYLAAKNARKDAEATMRAIEARLCEQIGDCEGVVGDGWRALWSWRKESTRKAQPARVMPGHRAFDLRAVGAKKDGGEAADETNEGEAA